MSIDTKKIKRVNNIYNKYHSPEAVTNIISINKASFKVEFTGSYCVSCGFYDYFDDYKILLQEHEAMEHGIYAVYPHNRHLAAKVRTFVEFLAGYFVA